MLGGKLREREWVEVEEVREEGGGKDSLTHTHTHTHTLTLAQDYEAAQLGWEQRELELEQQLDQLKQQQGRVASAATRMERAAGNIPDPHVRFIHCPTSRVASYPSLVLKRGREKLFHLPLLPTWV